VVGIGVTAKPVSWVIVDSTPEQLRDSEYSVI